MIKVEGRLIVSDGHDGKNEDKVGRLAAVATLFLVLVPCLLRLFVLNLLLPAFGCYHHPLI